MVVLPDKLFISIGAGIAVFKFPDKTIQNKSVQTGTTGGRKNKRTPGKK